MPWKPEFENEAPSLGWEVLQWMEAYLAAPDKADYEPFIPTREQAEFILKFYQIDPKTGKRVYRRGVISRPRGWGKSPLLAALAAVEGLAPVLHAGWDANGRPVGRPWTDVRTPLVQLAAVSEAQTKNSWAPLQEMLAEGPVYDEYNIDVMQGFIALPRGRIEPITASPRTVKGNKPVFAILDQTEEWVPSNSGVSLAQTMRSNAAKIGGSTVESPNAFTPGEGSVAEISAQYYKLILEGKARDKGLLYDHREAPPETDMSDRESLRAGLLYAYGDSAADAGGWVDLDRIIGEIWDPATNPQVARSDFLNQITHAADSWLSQPEWNQCADPTKIIADSDPIVLGFDGSRGRPGRRSKADSTVFVGCRVSDGHLFLIEAWEEPEGALGKDWTVPAHLVDSAVRSAMQRYNVVGFYADPAKFEDMVGKWEYDYHKKLKVRVTADHPVAWWMNRTTLTARALESLHSAIVEKEMTHDGSYVLTKHFLNARNQPTRSGMLVRKETPESDRKIDAVPASALAWQARLDALANGVNQKKRVQSQPPRRVR